MRFIIIMCISMLLFTGCSNNPFGNIMKKIGSKQKNESSDTNKAAAMNHKVKVKRPASSCETENTKTTVKVEACSTGIVAEVPSGAEVEIESEATEKMSKSMEIQSEETGRQENEKKAGLPWGVYVAVICLIAGGVFVAFKFSVSWGIPLIIGGVLVYGIFTAFNRYPQVVSFAVCGASVLTACGYILHTHKASENKQDLQNKAAAINTFKRAVDNATDSVKQDIKQSIKKVVGDKTNPERKRFDSEIEKA